MRHLFFEVVGLVVIALAVTMNPARTAHGPKFSDYPAPIYHGKIAAPVIDTPDKKKFRTMIREQAGKPDFAGWFKVATWGCGALCQTGVVIDTKTGNIVWLPHTVCCWNEDDQPFYYRLNSRLIVFGGQLDEDGPKGAHYFLFDGNSFKRLLTVSKESSNQERVVSGDNPAPEDRDKSPIWLISHDPNTGPLWKCYQDGMRLMTDTVSETSTDERYFVASLIVLGGPTAMSSKVTNACNREVLKLAENAPVPDYAARVGGMFSMLMLTQETDLYDRCLQHQENDWLGVKQLCSAKRNKLLKQLGDL
ncbi:conserved exported hypothetical protein [Mesorhizobium plurifarium]|uniref:Uncharacterized protein n=1 Tax=Mesorhizobium plurifarium TaxID=69974 RepID=A0A0K2VNE0_MESPL|nr:conserved exported hypothetical protein [Mesorhizobium plurifarium]